jgi:hypothetical protein
MLSMQGVEWLLLLPLEALPGLALGLALLFQVCKAELCAFAACQCCSMSWAA